MVGVSTPDGTAWRYLHDPLGRRIAKQRLAGGQVVEETRFTWDGVHLAEQSHRGAQRPDVLTTTWDRDGIRPVSQVEPWSMADAAWNRCAWSPRPDLGSTGKGEIDESSEAR